MGKPSFPSAAASRRALFRAAGGLAAAGMIGGTSAAVLPGVEDERAGDEYMFGVFPYLPPLTLDRLFAEIVGALSSELQRPVRLRMRSTFEAFAAELPSGRYDFAFLHPFLYLDAARYGYVPLARVDQPMETVFLTTAATGLRSLSDVAGHILALPPPLAAVSQITALALDELGLTPGIDLEVRHFQSKASCLEAVLLRSAAACGYPRSALGRLPVGSEQDFQVFDQRSLPVGLVIAAHPRVPAATRERLTRAMLDWPATEAGREILATAGWPRLVAASDSDYASLRPLVAQTQRQALQR